ncbi:MAG TPA: glycosyltransferase [Burkholderiaceae bacterium]
MIGVCIPAHDEETHIGRCLESVICAAQHPGLQGEQIKVVLVLDSCTDATASIAAQWSVIPLATSACNVGRARGLGAELLLGLGARWLAFTDADSRVSPRWLVDQLSLGADVVCGTVEVLDWAAHGPQARNARTRFEVSYADRDGHRHVHGANLGVSARHYRRAGGFDARTCGEDQALVDRLAMRGARVAWSALPRVTTSARPYSRVEGGFATALRQGWQMTCDPHLHGAHPIAQKSTTTEVPRPAPGMAVTLPFHPPSGD